MNTTFLPLRFGPCVLLTIFLSACGGLPQEGRTPSSALTGNGTRLAAGVAPRVAAHPGQSGIHALADGRDALAARLALADAAQRSLDVQYFIWNKDMVGKVLIEHLFRAADRGVRVRLLLDDLGTMPSDKALLAIDSHPNVEVRMFNPVLLRTPRVLGMVTEFGRINRRMHNKSFTVDNQVSIVGGRNIGDEYYGASEGANFADLDVAVIGPVVKEVSNAFDLYWNHPAAVPITALSHQRITPEEFTAMREALMEVGRNAERSAYADTVRESAFVQKLGSHTTPFYWGRAVIVSDHPDKVLTSASQRDTHLAPQLLRLVDQTRRELFLVSPYFVPGKDGVALLTSVRKRGVRVVIITNSLASTDGIPVHSGYQRYRKALLRAGVELYEMKPTPGAKDEPDSEGLRGSSDASLHAKTFAFDRRMGFVGSYNLDPRSNKLNTEMGVLFDCPELVKRIPEGSARSAPHNAWRVELDGNRLVWVTLEGDRQVRSHAEPGVSPWRKFQVGVLSWLPIEWLL